MYKVPEMTQEEAFSLFMRGLEPRIREQIGYQVKGDLSWAIAMAKKADVWRSRGEGQNQKGQNQQKVGGSGQWGQGKNPKGNKKPWWGKKDFGTQSRGKGLLLQMEHSVMGPFLWLPRGQTPKGIEIKSAEVTKAKVSMPKMRRQASI